MSKNSLFLLITLCSLVFPITLLAQVNGTNYGDGVYVSSKITLAITPGSAQGFCTTEAKDPTTGQNTNTAAGYLYFSTQCTVTGSDGTEISSNDKDTSSGNWLFPNCHTGALGESYPDFGSGDAGNPSGDCTITFPITQGATYTLTSQHSYIATLHLDVSR
jgi:hypothetical protein